MVCFLVAALNGKIVGAFGHFHKGQVSLFSIPATRGGQVMVSRKYAILNWIEYFVALTVNLNVDERYNTFDFKTLVDWPMQ